MIQMNLKMKLINNWKRKIEPMELTLETINLGNDECNDDRPSSVYWAIGPV